MKLTFDIAATEFVTVRDILADILPPECRVWVFGSRAKNQARFNSDLDLALESNGKLPPIILHRLKEAFNEAALTYRVDVLDINDVSENFQTIIRQQAISFPLAKSDKVPKLRFPEFSGEWEERKLGEIVKIERGRFSPRPRNDPKYYGGEIPFVQTSDVVKSKGKIREYSQTLNNLGLGASKLFPKGSLLITIAANIGYAGVLELDMACPDSLIGLTCSKSLNNYFLNYILEIEQPKMDYLAVEAAQKNINIEFLKPYKIDYPTLPEQQKIASFLSSVDTKIDQLTKKKNLLEHYKRGIMQKLFSQELRFKDAQGKAFPEWVEKRLGEVATFKKGKGISKADIIEDGKNPCIRYGELYTEYNEVIKSIVSRTNTEVGSSILSEKNDILMPTSDVTPNGLATASALNETGIILGGDILIIRSQKILNSFFCYFVASHKNKIMRLVSGVTVYHIYGSDMATLHVNAPSLSEQKKIAAFLSAIDQKTNLITTELKHAKTFKKGLLQQIFI